LDEPNGQHNLAYSEGLRLLNGLPLLSEEGQEWIQSKAGSRLPPTVINKFRLPWQNCYTTISSPESKKIQVNDLRNLQLPARKAVATLATVFCSTIQSLIFPVLSHDLFVGGTLDLAYQKTGIEQPGADSAGACVHALLAMISVFGHESDNEAPNRWVTPQKHALEAEAYLPSILREMTVNGLEALMMLTVYKYFMGDLQSASILVSASSRLIYRLGAHIPPTPSHPYDKRIPLHHIRDLFWVCYSFDKDLAHRLGQPPIINDDYCDLTLPPDYVQMQSFNIQGSNILAVSESTIVPLYPWDLRLSTIKSRVSGALHSVNASKQPQTEILRRIRCLDEELEDWRLSLPVDHRPTLSFLKRTPVDIHMNTQAVMLRLAYHHCVILIHQARSRILELTSLMSTGVSGERDVDISLMMDASKSTLLYLQKALPVVAHECFWVIIFYPLTAIFTIFFGALSNPLMVSVTEDLELLQNFPRVLRQIPIRTLTIAEIAQLEFLDELVVALGELSLAAVQKATHSVS
ncbi:unnamed protein product, partial [Clonostachys rhizophaga]